MNMIAWLIENKIAKNEWNAQAIISGLKLYELYEAQDFGGIQARAKLYRDHRNSGEKSKTAFEKAIKRELVPDPMFDDVLHSAQGGEEGEG